MEKVIIINKPLGCTSNDVIDELKKQYPGEKIGHAGTLDPLAQGVLICLIGEETNKNQSNYMYLDKEYVFDILFGFKTDTHDVLGLITENKDYDPEDINTRLKNFLPGFKGIHEQRVPVFSAVKYKGKPLYRWYLSGRIAEVPVPTREIEIKSIKLLEAEIITGQELRAVIVSNIKLVKKGFRQETILKTWKDFFKKPENLKRNYLVAKIKTEVTKGTYVRSIADTIGEQLKTGACTITIKRTRVGEYEIN